MKEMTRTKDRALRDVKLKTNVQSDTQRYYQSVSYGHWLQFAADKLIKATKNIHIYNQFDRMWQDSTKMSNFQGVIVIFLENSPSCTLVLSLAATKFQNWCVVGLLLFFLHFFHGLPTPLVAPNKTESKATPDYPTDKNVAWPKRSLDSYGGRFLFISIHPSI